MTKLSIDTVSLILSSLFFAGLVFDQASGDQQQVIPRQPALSDCPYPDSSAFSHCPGAMDRTIELAVRNGWARVNRKDPRAALPTFEKGEPYSTVRKRLKR
jgi:hypothetical protein